MLEPQVGHAYQVKEADYCYGTGTILVQVTAVLGQIEYKGEPWWRLKARVAVGTVINHGGWQDWDSIDVRGANLIWQGSRFRRPSQSNQADHTDHLRSNGDRRPVRYEPTPGRTIW